MHLKIIEELNSQAAGLEACADGTDRMELRARLILAASVMRKAVNVLSAPVLTDDDVPMFLRHQVE